MDVKLQSEPICMNYKQTHKEQYCGLNNEPCPFDCKLDCPLFETKLTNIMKKKGVKMDLINKTNNKHSEV